MFNTVVVVDVPRGDDDAKAETDDDDVPIASDDDDDDGRGTTNDADTMLDSTADRHVDAAHIAIHEHTGAQSYAYDKWRKN